jgi:NitT/TauT family transport system permease protein
VPPVAWLAIALLWLGPRGPTPAFTVAVTILPIVYVAAFEGLASRDARLDELSLAFRAPRRQWLTDILAPQWLGQLLPALTTALGLAWKVCVMSEVMSSGTGIGGRLATARAHLDLPETMAWVLLVTLVVLACDLALLAPLRQWLTAARAPLSRAAF